MRYTTSVRRPDNTTYEASVDTTAGDTQALELAKNLAESYGHELIALKDADGKEIYPMGEKLTRGDDEQDSSTEERVEEQDQTTTERVETQEVEVKDVKPDKTGDVKPNR